jgi:hypothetical protein
MVRCKISFGWWEGRFYRGIAIADGVFVWCFAGVAWHFRGGNVVFRVLIFGGEFFPLFRDLFFAAGRYVRSGNESAERILLSPQVAGRWSTGSGSVRDGPNLKIEISMWATRRVIA